jgi:transcriptional regulator with XRE-family HTH domain
VGNLESDIKPKRKAQDINLRELEQLTGINRGELSRIERGRLVYDERQKRLIEEVLGEVAMWALEERDGLLVRIPIRPA